MPRPNQNGSPEKGNINSNDSRKNSFNGEEGVLQNELQAEYINDEAASNSSEAAEYIGKVLGDDYGASLDNKFILQTRDSIARNKATHALAFQERIANLAEAVHQRGIAKNSELEAIEVKKIEAISPNNSWKDKFKLTSRVNNASALLNENQQFLLESDNSNSSKRPLH
jgi:hypothetical protein